MKSIVDSFKRLLSLPGRLSVAARGACCLLLGLVLLLIGIWISYTCSPRHIPWSAYMSWSRGGILAALIIGVAAVAYFTIRTWLSDDRADRSIRSIWSAGLQELRHHGLPLDGLPIHLILGAGTGDEADRLIRSSGVYRFVQQPRGTAEFTFSANPTRLCLNAGGVGRLALARSALADEINRWSPDDDSRLLELLPAASTESQGSCPDADGLLLTLQKLGLEPTDGSEDEPAAEDDWQSGGGGGTALKSPPQAPAARAVAQPITLLKDPLEARPAPQWSLAEAAAADRKLIQLASLIRAGRRPLCPVNRILVVVPAALLLSGSPRIADLQRALRRDLEILKETLQVNAPVTVLISGLESHPGFSELIRRAGPQVVQQQTLGQAVEVGSITNPAQMESLAINACGQVEDAIYALLRKDSSLSSPGNLALYRLLCDVRTGIRQSLRDLLVGTFAAEKAGNSAPGQSVAGCYFCASGTSPQQTGFVEPVLRLQDRAQEELEWFPSALERDALHRLLSRAGWLATAGLAGGWLCQVGAWLSR